MRVDDALGVARGAARVAHGGCGVLVRFRVVEAGRLSGDELVVAVHGAAGGDQRRRVAVAVAVADDDPRLDRRELRRYGPDDRQERRVDEHDAIPGVVRHVHQLLARQADVERVEHSAHARDGEVRLEVLLVVPHERADRIARADPEAAERGGEPVGVVSHLRYVARRTPSPVNVTHSEPAWTRRPWRRMVLIVSGKSLMVERIMRSSFRSGAEVALAQQCRVVAQLLSGAAQRDRSMAEHIGALGNGQSEVHVLLDEEHAGARLVGDGAHGGQQALHGDRCQAEAELVDEQQPRLARERSGDCQHLLLPTGQETRWCAQARLQLGEQLERVPTCGGGGAGSPDGGSRGRSASGTGHGRRGSTPCPGGRCAAPAIGRSAGHRS